MFSQQARSCEIPAMDQDVGVRERVGVGDVGGGGGGEGGREWVSERMRMRVFVVVMGVEVGAMVGLEG